MVRTTALIAATLFAAHAFAHEDDAKSKSSSQGLGKVSFKTSCSKAAQPKFNRGVALLHSFWYPEAEAAFKDIVAQEPSCTIAYWGLASILMNNPIAGQGAVGKAPEMAQAALEQARANPPKTQRERDYLEAVSAYYKDFAQRTERERQQARAEAYEKLAAKYPKDDEAQIFYAVYLAATQSLNDKTYGPTLKAAGILEQQFKKYPQHPGRRALPHPQLRLSADRAEGRERRAPLREDRAGRAARAAHALAHLHARRRLGGLGADQRALGRPPRARATRATSPGTRSTTWCTRTCRWGATARREATWNDALKYMNISPRFVAPYAIAAIPARLAIERGDWKAAAALEPRPTQVPVRRRDDAFRARAGQRAHRQSRTRRSRSCWRIAQAARAAASRRRTATGPPRSR